MTAFERETQVLDTEIFPRHKFADLNSGITFIVFFSQDEPLRSKEINTYRHGHTQTRAHS